MMERPILFSGPMVQAILAGRKTQTRRVMKPAPIEVSGTWCWPHAPSTDLARATALMWTGPRGPVLGRTGVARCPYGQPGDRLWVKETWRSSVAADSMSPTMLEGHGWPVWYACDGMARWIGARTGGVGFTTPGKTRVSIHMPRWASRLTLEVTEVRVQRLQEISEEDAGAEGIAELPLQEGLPGAWWSAAPTQPEVHSRTARGAFWKLWDSINGERPDCSWEANPWTWCISFKVLP